MRLTILGLAAIAAATLAGCAGPYVLDRGAVAATVGEAGVTVRVEAVIRRIDRGGYSPDQARAELERLSALQRGLAIGRAAFDIAAGGLPVAPSVQAGRDLADGRIAEAAERLAAVARS